MKVLLVGSGGREHALAWKLAQSPLLGRLFIAPGNPGTAQWGENIPLAVDDFAGILSFCREKAISLVIIGPEAPLAAGLADSLAGAGISCFGPSQAAAQIEASKAFAKDFMARHNIPTARYATFQQLPQALEHIRQVSYPVVIKASGLAAGKGVVLPESQPEAEEALREIMTDRIFGEAGAEVVIEERLQGQEISLMAFCDGKTLAPLPPAQDHKRIFDGDKGPNTGGMGSYSAGRNLPFLGEQDLEEGRDILQGVVSSMKKEGIPFVGVLYGQFMATRDGLVEKKNPNLAAEIVSRLDDIGGLLAHLRKESPDLRAAVTEKPTTLRRRYEEVQSLQDQLVEASLVLELDVRIPTSILVPR